ncbi:unnamed protein product [Brugia timori]|uniref:Uncharacterized protein n=1 Tax=Brugia timori TaxID=42155 RepID=A0A0R3Q5U9_9BILA|nr:unnamed protein product [Brugia timori]
MQWDSILCGDVKKLNSYLVMLALKKLKSIRIRFRNSAQTFSTYAANKYTFLSLFNKKLISKLFE